jgi:hypothetical protein
VRATGPLRRSLVPAMSLHPNVGRVISSPPPPLCSRGANYPIYGARYLSRLVLSICTALRETNMRCMNLARFLPHSLRVCSSVSVGLYVTAVNVSDPSTVPSNSPHSWLALWPNLFQSFKAISRSYFYGISPVPCGRIGSHALCHASRLKALFLSPGD